jgi:hypothetical protein
LAFQLLAVLVIRIFAERMGLDQAIFIEKLMGSDQAMLLRFTENHFQNASFEALNCHFHGQK